ncbi:MAG: hypothetical protein LBS50_10650 [Prevotellaceae bacterium]|jgi:hypothetical protein|nr:hypothetical protein [Prevotellaceae bacterium]
MLHDKSTKIIAIELDILMLYITSDNQELTEILNFNSTFASRVKKTCER